MPVDASPLDKHLAYECPDDGLGYNLNHSCLAHLEEHAHLLNGGQKWMLREINCKLHDLPKRFNRRGDPATGEHNQQYAETAGLILMSAWSDRFRFCRCGVLRMFEGRQVRFNCENLWFCPYCCHRRRLKLLDRFAHSFDAGRWSHLTVSYRQALSFVEPPGQLIEPYWDAVTTALRLMVKAGYLRGVYWAEELHLESFAAHMPVLPHLHALVDAEQFGELEQIVLEILIEEYRGRSWDYDLEDYVPDASVRVSLPLSIRCRPLVTQRDQHNVVGYLCKPLDLATPYLAGVEQCLRGERSFCELNQAKDDLLLGIETLFGAVRADKRSDRLNGRVRFAACGTLDGRSRRIFIGVRRAVRETRAHRRLTKLHLHEAQLNEQIAVGGTGAANDAADPGCECSTSACNLPPTDTASGSTQPTSASL